MYVSDPLQFLGSGQVHAVIGLGRSIVAPLNGREVPLAVSFNRRFAYTPRDRGQALENRIGAFNYRFERGDTVPYFLSVVSATASDEGYPPRRLAGILTEDVSNGKKNRLEELPDNSYCVRVLPDGLRERIYFDPAFGAMNSGGKLWLEERARIDLK